MNTLLNVLNYFFNPIPGSPFHYYTALLVLAALFIIFGIALRWKIKRASHENKSFKRLFSHLPKASYWIALLLLLNAFGRYERFPLLGARFFLYGTIFIALYVFGKAAYVFFKVYPRERLRFKETPAQKKYTIEKYSRR